MQKQHVAEKKGSTWIHQKLRLGRHGMAGLVRSEQLFLNHFVDLGSGFFSKCKSKVIMYVYIYITLERPGATIKTGSLSSVSFCHQSLSSLGGVPPYLFHSAEAKSQNCLHIQW